MEHSLANISSLVIDMCPNQLLQKGFLDIYIKLVLLLMLLRIMSLMKMLMELSLEILKNTEIFMKRGLVWKPFWAVKICRDMISIASLQKACQAVSDPMLESRILCTRKSRMSKIIGMGTCSFQCIQVI